MTWHQPQISHQATSSDLLRGFRQVEEPDLTLALWQQTPQTLRWKLSPEALQRLVQITGDDEERAWALQQLDTRGRAAERAAASRGARAAGKGGGKDPPWAAGASSKGG